MPYFLEDVAFVTLVLWPRAIHSLCICHKPHLDPITYIHGGLLNHSVGIEPQEVNEFTSVVLNHLLESNTTLPGSALTSWSKRKI